MTDPTAEIIAAVDAWLAAIGRPERCAPATAMQVATLMAGDYSHLPAYLAQLPPPTQRNPWGWLFGCLRASYAQFAADEERREAKRAEAIAAARRALAEAEAKRCRVCHGTGVRGQLAGVECGEDVQRLLKAGNTLCACEMGQVWMEML